MVAPRRHFIFCSDAHVGALRHLHFPDLCRPHCNLRAMGASFTRLCVPLHQRFPSSCRIAADLHSVRGCLADDRDTKRAAVARRPAIRLRQSAAASIPRVINPADFRRSRDLRNAPRARRRRSAATSIVSGAWTRKPCASPVCLRTPAPALLTMSIGFDGQAGEQVQR